MSAPLNSAIVGICGCAFDAVDVGKDAVDAERAGFAIEADDADFDALSLFTRPSLATARK